MKLDRLKALLRRRRRMTLAEGREKDALVFQLLGGNALSADQSARLADLQSLAR